MINSSIERVSKVKIILLLGIIVCIFSITTKSYATIRGDSDEDSMITAYDAYLVLVESLEDPINGSYEESILQLIDMDCDTDLTSYDAYSILRKSVADNITDYITPEMYGAVGDGITDDTNAFQQCMNSDTKNIILTGDYLIKRTVTSTKEKNIYNGKIICNNDDYRVFTFRNTVSFTDTIFVSDRSMTGTAAHGETFTRSSNTSFVDAWGDYNTFEGCVFHNALTAIRGRISTGATVVPENLNVNHCRFTECKIPIQGYFAHANVNNSSFKNDGDVFSGEHSIYLDTLGSVELNVRGCKIETYNSESGASVQIYGKSEVNQITITPAITIENCTISANGVVSTDLADVIVTNTYFEAQHQQRFVFTVEEGTLLINSGYYNHAYFISGSTMSGGVTPVANSCTFRIKKEITNDRCYYPYNANNCTFINWGGTVACDNTRLYGCIFTRDVVNVVGKYYVAVYNPQSVYIEESAFKSGDNISYNSSGYLELRNCHYINNIGTNVTNYQEIGTIHEDIVD